MQFLFHSNQKHLLFEGQKIVVTNCVSRDAIALLCQVIFGTCIMCILIVRAWSRKGSNNQIGKRKERKNSVKGIY